MSFRSEESLDHFWQCLRQDATARLTSTESARLAADHNRHACSKCGRVHAEDRVAVAPCLNCGRWICYECHNPDLPFGSVGDFNYFLVDAGKIKELSCSGIRLWPILCPYCVTNVPKPEIVHAHLLPERFRQN